VAFTILEELFEPTVMFFGLTNSLATFQVMMNEILRDLINTGKVASFIDNIIVGTKEEEGHNEIVEQVIRRIEENYLYMKPEKCRWKVRGVRFLGVVIGRDGIKMEEEKVKAVLDWPTPKSVKDIQTFLGLANYYRQFIKDFTKIARPLHELTRKEQKWKWEIGQEKSFEVLKKRFITKPILVAPDLDKKMRMEMDASNFVTRGVLSIECEDRRWRPVAYLFKSLNETERNYEIHDKEMLAVIRELEAWRYLLEGIKFKFKVWTDHKNLEYFMKA